MNVNKIDFFGRTLIDLTADTVTAENLLEGYTAHDKSGALITGEYIPPEVPALPIVNSVSTTGEYDTVTYHGDCFAAIDANGNLLISVIGGTSGGYESIFFETASVPSGVSLVAQSFYSYASMTLGAAYVAIYSGITESVDVLLDFNALYSGGDYVRCAVSITSVSG